MSFILLSYLHDTQDKIFIFFITGMDYMSGLGTFINEKF